jgi:alkyl hydroperoxide reductase subunit AhpC
MNQFKARNVQVYGISGGSEKTKASFCKKYGLSVPLVSDSDFKVAKSYGAYGMKKFMGRSFQGIFRKTFLVDKNGKIARVFATVKPEGHADEVLEAIDALQKGSPKSSMKAAKKQSTKKPVAVKKAAGRKKATVKAKPVAKKATSPRKALSGRKVAKKVAAKPAKRAVAKKK